jgi:uncharacterized membrane protein YjjP (DUF1212 family)
VRFLLQPFRTWRLPRARWIFVTAYVISAAVLLVLGSGAWTALLAILVALVLVTALELWFRRRHPAPAPD